MAEAPPIRLAVLGHVNAGKTSLVRALARRTDIGRVDPAPGTTEQAQVVLRAMPGAPPLALVDTPGLQDPVTLAELVRAVPHGHTALERLRWFLKRPDAQSEFEPECRALRTALEADAVLYVLDARELVLPKFRSEIELLQACARSTLVVLNRLDHPHSRAADWNAALAGHGLTAVCGFDPIAPTPQAQAQFVRLLAGVLATTRPDADALGPALRAEDQARRRRQQQLIASTLVGLAALRHTVGRAEVADEAKRAERVEAFRRQVVDQARAARRALADLHGFPGLESALGELPGVNGRWDEDLFDPEALRLSAQKLGTGAAIGAAIGLGLDIALAGLSLGVGTAVGAAIGGVANQGFGPMGRALVNKVTGQQDLTLEGPVIVLVAQQLIALDAAFERRGHGATGPLAAALAAGEAPAIDAAAAEALVEALSAARHHADWAIGHERDDSSGQRRQALVDRLAAALERAATAPPALPQEPDRAALPPG
ncbi:DUF3482 domain-containing protein [Ideonella sp.]|uniref:DUF3482 domain-containing protein n=1 Tax=Ideonella sp. TaxID=1929293 RepID=UPI002B461875|nr:DUF3482 domain-containing protein [Ideonella sp.]HJV67981.1 DUF3482 domain-containing protein [Ideonella sp.]